MSLMTTLKAASLQARKNRQADAAATLSTLIGEAAAIGKNAGDRETTDLEVIQIIKKFIKNIDEVIHVRADAGLPYDAQVMEKVLLETFLPPQMSLLELELTIVAIKNEISAGPKDMGKILKLLKERHEGLYDGAAASNLAKAALV